ncbi:MAG: PocR ligand-binding domain-containing protein [Desulfobacterales bacterium]|nr:PocR ligand-binding domain-containing protein [Desulfobacterales bacterium]MDD4073089.1 PocR ligand-binding domain-containing protein [Desulfobacterales bacterium]MDD4393491.1 PocR ligand-binding domain-containing protein [Desulfobacterales bacterium]
MNQYSFSDLLDIDQIQQMMDLFYKATGIPVGIIDIDGDILVATGWQDICLKFHRLHPDTCRRCRESDDYIKSHLEPGKYIEYRCKNGLWDLGVPITVSGSHLATLFLGQFFYEDEQPDIDFFRKQADAFGFEVQSYLDALKRVPIFSREKVRAIMEFYVGFVNFLSALGLKNLALADDISHREIIEKQLKNNLNFMETLIDTIPNPVYYKNTDGIYLGCNQTFSDSIFNMPREKIIGHSLIELIERLPGNVADFYRMKDKELIQHPGTQTCEVRYPDQYGNRRDFIINKATYTDEAGKVSGIVGVFSDMTEKNIAEERLKESETRYRDLYENAPTPYFSIRPEDGAILKFNTAATKLLGYDPDTLSNMMVFDLYADTPNGIPKAKQIFNQFVSGKPVHDFEIQMKHQNGAPLWVSLSVEPVIDEQGRIIESRSVVLDISERKRMEDQLQQVHKMEAIGTLAGGIAHDFNNILSAIIGYSEIAMIDSADTGKVKDALQQVLKAGDRARDLINQILMFSKQSIMEKKPINISYIIKDSLKLLKATLPSTIQIHQFIETHIPAVSADPTQLHQVVINLCTNAAHAMEAHGGIMEIHLKEVELDSKEAAGYTGLAPGRYVKLLIRDTGHGMDRETVNRLFDPYFTTKEPGRGTGLGLAVVHGIVKHHGGAIKVYSQPGIGSDFHICFPVEKQNVTFEPEPAQTIYTGSERILFVDDEAFLVDLVRQMLEKLGYRVESRTDPVEALDLFKSDPFAFDLIITDLTMPGLTGITLSEKIHQIRPEIPIILCSGYAEKLRDETVRRTGIKKFLVKPFTLSSLSGMVYKALKKTDPL